MRPQFARYEVLGLLTSGGMADVWTARAVGPAGFEKRVVIKTIRQEVAADAEFTAMFLNEARLAAKLNHPNCVQIFDLGREDGTYFIAMELIEGFSFSRALKRATQPVPIGVIARILMDAASGLDYAHGLCDPDGTPLALVHRDISPDNLLVSFTGQTKVVDFGIAKATRTTTADGTQTGQMKGKTGYMSPEYLRGQPIDRRADLFALGVVAYRALTGQRPYEGETDALVMKSVLDSDPPPPRTFNPAIPEALQEVVLTALQKNPNDRYVSARAMRAAIASALGSQVADTDEVGAWMESIWPKDHPEREVLRAPAPSPSASPPRPSESPTRSVVTPKPEAGPVPGVDAAPASLSPQPVDRSSGPHAPGRGGAEAAIASVPVQPPAGARRNSPGAFRAVAVLGGAVLIAAAAIGFGIRHGSSGAPASTAETPHAPIRVLIADFDNHTDDAVFDATLEPAFTVGIEGASFITSYNRTSARKLAGKIKEGQTRIDTAMAQLIATREGIDVVVSGAIESASGGYRLKVQALDAISGKPLLSRDSGIVSRQDVLHSVDAIASELRTVLGDTTPESSQLAARETFTTSSIEAAHEYAMAQQRSLDLHYEEATEHYKRALELDPEFGRAYLGLAIVAVNEGHAEEGDRLFKQGLARLDRMTEREKERSLATYYLIRHDAPSAIEHLNVLVQKYPADSTAHSNLALAYFFERDFDRALTEGRNAAAIYPGDMRPATNVGWYLLYSGDFEGALKHAQQLVQNNPGATKPRTIVALAQTGLGRLEDAKQTYGELRKTGGYGASIGVVGLADVALIEGRDGDAVSLLEGGIADAIAAKDGDGESVKRAMLAWVRLARGEKTEAIAEADKVAKSTNPAVRFSVARTYLQAGDEAKARAVIALLTASTDPEPQVYAALLDGEAKLQKGQARDAVKAFQDAQKLADTWLGRYGLGRAYLAARAFPDAYAQFETCLKRRGEAVAVFLDDVPSYHELSPVHYFLGRAQEGLGSPAARESYATFVSFKAKDDRDPIVLEARGRLEKLQR